MQKVITDALCIRAEDFGENGKILTLLTAEFGKIAAGIRGVKAPTSKLKTGASILAFGEYELLQKAGGKYNVIGVNIKEGFYDCWENLEKFATSEVILELADRASSTDGEVAEELVLTLQALSEVNYGEHSPYIVAVWYFLKIMAATGIDFHDEQELPTRVMAQFDAIASLEPQDLGALELTPAELVELLRYNSLISARILGSELKSLKESLKIITR